MFPKPMSSDKGDGPKGSTRLISVAHPAVRVPRCLFGEVQKGEITTAFEGRLEATVKPYQTSTVRSWLATPRWREQQKGALTMPTVHLVTEVVTV